MHGNIISPTNFMSFHISLRSLDLGFDPRPHHLPCIVPCGISAVLYDRRPKAGVVTHDSSCIATGSAAQIQATLMAQGYRITWDKTFRHHDLDGAWNRLTDDGILEMRDPNEGQGGGPASKSRWQVLRSEHGHTWTRRLPREGLDRWRDAVTPEDMTMPWQMLSPHHVSSWGLVQAYLQWMDTDSWQCWRPAPVPRITVGDAHDPEWVLAAYTPTQREVRWSRQKGLYEIQPPRDNYWRGFTSLTAALSWYQQKGEAQ